MIPAFRLHELRRSLWQLSRFIRSRILHVDLLLRDAHVVFQRPVSKLILEYVQYTTTSPSLLAISVVCEVIWRYSTQSSVDDVRPRPGIAGSGDDIGRRCEHFCLLGRCVDGDHGHS
jgi:hypothetical protein